MELYVLEDIPHLSSYGLGRAGVQESSFNPDSSAAAGQWIYFVSNTSDFVSFVGAVPGPAGYYEIRPAFFDFTGDEAFQLFQSGIVEDTFGVVGTSSFGQPWDYQNSWVLALCGIGRASRRSRILQAPGFAYLYFRAGLAALWKRALRSHLRHQRMAVRWRCSLDGRDHKPGNRWIPRSSCVEIKVSRPLRFGAVSTTPPRRASRRVRENSKLAG